VRRPESLARGETTATPAGPGTGPYRLRCSEPAKFNAESLAIVKQIRAKRPEVPVLVRGSSAEFYDLQATLGSHLQLAAAIMILITRYCSPSRQARSFCQSKPC
jgi:hypothetical protein